MIKPCEIRVASRYVEAGLLKVPPAMVKEITKWVQDTFCTWIVKKTKPVNRDLIRQVWREEKGLGSIDRRAVRGLNNTLETLQEWGSRPNSWGRFDDLLYESKGTLRKYLVSLNLDKDSFKKMTRQETKVLYDQTYKRFLPILKREIESADREFQEASKRLTSLKSNLTQADLIAYQGGFIPKTLKVSPEVLQSAKKRLKSSQPLPTLGGYLSYSKGFDPNFNGWPYANLIPTQMLHIGDQKAEKTRVGGPEVHLNIKEIMPEVGGSFIETGHEMETQWIGQGRLIFYANVPKLLQSRSGYKRLMREIETAVRHELQHYVQKLFQDIGIKEFGIPSKSIRDLRFSPSGFASLKGLDDNQRTMREYYEHGQKPYPLIDAEFYPWLEDNVDTFLEWASSQNLERSEWDRARKDWVESQNPNVLHAQGVGNANFWKELKKHEPAKWRKAVSEFWKATDSPSRK